MRIVLRFRVEALDDGRPMWTVDSPQVPGFFSTRESLRELQIVSEFAITEALAVESGGDMKIPEFEYVIATNSPTDDFSGDDVQVPVLEERVA